MRRDARSFIDGFLQQRGYLPLQQRFGIVVGWHRAITRYLLHKDRLGEGARKTRSFVTTGTP
ncbi:DUF1320 family protein [Pseudomonas aeruginosa]|nr:DUF1320 family protein [Pseudomonas aeruginosa]